MSHRPLVSVVVPSFNQARFVREAVDSILNQDYPHMEILAIDGASTDGTAEILRSYGDRIALVSEPDRGQADAINKGFRRARGEILAWLNSDDRYLPGAVGAAVTALEAQPLAGMVYGEGELLDEVGEVMGRFPATQPFDLWALIHVSDYIMQPTVFMRATHLRATGGLDESLHYGLDWDLWIRLACRAPVVYTPERIAQTREYGATKTARGGWERLKELRAITTRHGASGWTPGLVTYGLDTLRRLFPVVFGPSTLSELHAQRRRWLPWFLSPVHMAVNYVISRQLRDAQGVWLDGWMGPRAHMAVAWSGEPGLLTAHAEVPPDPRLLPFTLEMQAAGARASIVRAQPGSFRLQMEVARADPGPRALPVRLNASPWQRFPGDQRRLSCFLRGLTFEPA